MGWQRRHLQTLQAKLKSNGPFVPGRSGPRWSWNRAPVKEIKIEARFQSRGTKNGLVVDPVAMCQTVCGFDQGETSMTGSRKPSDVGELTVDCTGCFSGRTLEPCESGGVAKGRPAGRNSFRPRRS